MPPGTSNLFIWIQNLANLSTKCAKNRTFKNNPWPTLNAEGVANKITYPWKMLSTDQSPKQVKTEIR